jgi:hypothetical protein
MTGMHHCAQSLVDMGSQTFCLGWPLNHDPPYLHLQSKQDYRLEPPCLESSLLLLLLWHHQQFFFLACFHFPYSSLWRKT